MPTILDIAREAQVSKTVASDILRGAGSSRFHEDTRQRVLRTAQTMGYTPNRAARTLVTGRTNLIALWMPHLLSAYYARIAHLIALRLRTSPYDLLIGHLGRTPPSHVDGVLALVDSPTSVSYIRDVHARLKLHGSLPALCLMGCNMDAHALENADAVSVDLEKATHEAVAHLLESGCSRLAFMTGDSPSHREEARYAAFTDAMKRARRTPEYIEIVNSALEPRAAARAAMHQHATRGTLPDGIICLNDELAIGTHRGLRECGLHVPHDVALIGCDGIEDTEYVEPTLSTMAQPIDAMCERAWELLQRRIEDPASAPLHEIMRAKLILRASSQREVSLIES